MKVSVVGATGYGGAELVRLLHNHSIVEKISVHSSSHMDTLYSHSYPHFTEALNYTLEKIDANKIAQHSDYVFLATPAGISTKITPELVAGGAKVIDLSGDFRFHNPRLYEKWYKNSPASKEWLEQAVYGLPEVNKDRIRTADLIANPGCYPTATILGLVPLLQNVEIEEDSIIVDAKSAVSGAGRGSNVATSFCEINDNFKIYKVNQHQHIPEIEQMLKNFMPMIKPIKFNTHLVPMTRGIMATIYCKPKTEMNEKVLQELYQTRYAKEPFVRVRGIGQFPATKEVYASNYCDIGLTFDERTGWITIVSVIDNLMKGASGQAIQNLNLMHGLEETTALTSLPVFP
ncbi:MAG: N-acetyl-gamma-glutamyl-phosphate reductase [Bacillaceae bacterium]|nr:N-acetyl-gamma-glutamyl-phosphate reductase [Bacillaceae bacterium]